MNPFHTIRTPSHHVANQQINQQTNVGVTIQRLKSLKPEAHCILSRVFIIQPNLHEISGFHGT